MSRCCLDNSDLKKEVTIGWDRAMGTFFAQVFERDGDKPIIWLGRKAQEITSPEELINVIAPYACKFNREVLANELLLDKQKNDERLYAIDGDKVW